MRGLATAFVLTGLLAGCASGDRGPAPAASGAKDRATATSGFTRAPKPSIVSAGRHLECVPYARRVSGIEIYGNAWTWWRQAGSRYRRDTKPAVGSVLAMKRTKKIRGGHISVVTATLSPREILVTHANWLNRGRIHHDVPVRDVSRNNDWSKVRVWYTPGNTWGSHVYSVHGFIHPKRVKRTPVPRPRPAVVRS